MLAYVWQLFKFFIVGSAGGLVALGIYYVMVRRGKYSKLFSNLISGIICQVINFFPQKYITFENLDESQVSRQMTEFVILGTVGVILNMIILHFVNKQSRFHFMINKVVTDFLCTIVIHLSSRFIF